MRRLDHNALERAGVLEQTTSPVPLAAVALQTSVRSVGLAEACPTARRDVRWCGASATAGGSPQDSNGPLKPCSHVRRIPRGW